METFKKIPALDRYEISKSGVVRNIKTNRLIKSKINPKHKRINIDLRLGVGNKKTFIVSRLVALTYLPNPDNLPVVDHIDRNIHNNHISNLRWVDSKVNMQNKLINKNCMYYDELCKKFIIQSNTDIRTFTYDNLDDALIHFKQLVV
jgi:hypothetical protein